MQLYLRKPSKSESYTWIISHCINNSDDFHMCYSVLWLDDNTCQKCSLACKMIAKNIESSGKYILNLLRKFTCVENKILRKMCIISKNRKKKHCLQDMVFELWEGQLVMLHWRWTQWIALHDGLEFHSFEPLYTQDCRKENDLLVHRDIHRDWLSPVHRTSEGIADSCKDCRHPAENLMNRKR